VREARATSVLPYALSLLAGAVLPLAFAPFGWFWLAPLSYAVLLYCWKDVPSGRAFWLGFVYGCASFGGGTYWTYIAVREMGGAPIAVALFLTIGLTMVCAAFIGAAGFIAARWFRTSGAAARLITLPALFVLCEWARGWMFTGFGWLSAGYSQTSSWLMGYAPVLGVYGMSWAVLVTAGALVVLLEAALAARAARGVAHAPTVDASHVAGAAREPSRSRYATVLAAVLGVAVIWLGGFALREHRWTAPQSRAISVALLQGAITQTLKWKPEQLKDTLALYARLTVQNLGVDLIVWPEAAVPTLIDYVPDYVDGLRKASAERGSTVLLGILRADPEAHGEQNVLVALTQPTQTYVKRHLVPFGEYFPVPPFIRSWMRLMNLPYTDITAGAPDQPLIDAAGQQIAVTICYEDVFGAEQLRSLPAATLLVDVSNDAWFGDSIAPHQHLQIAQVRAAEAGRYLLRATNTGVTAVVDDAGRVEATLPQFKPAVLKATVRGFEGATPYAVVGNWAVVLVALAAVAGRLPALATLTRRRRG
jgi:apolipoprotein N-acyltransferase